MAIFLCIYNYIDVVPSIFHSHVSKNKGKKVSQKLMVIAECSVNVFQINKLGVHIMHVGIEELDPGGLNNAFPRGNS